MKVVISFLTTVASRLVKQVRDGDIVSRLGGDEFTVILEHIDHFSDMEVLCHRIIAEVEKDIDFAGIKGRVTASIGVSVYPHDGIEVDVLIAKADNAMYIAQKAGQKPVCLERT
jgi:diguanylate cyclase (GGDEF)-like protein